MNFQVATSTPRTDLPRRAVRSARVQALLDSDSPYLTDGGMETTFVFHDGIDLPEFAAYDLLLRGEGRDRLRLYYERYLEIARRNRLGFVLETPTWRANLDWGRRIGTEPNELADINRLAVEELSALRKLRENEETPILVSGCVGPRGDGYEADDLYSVEQNRVHHSFQVSVLAAAGVDLVTAITMTNVSEAVGIAQAARSAGVPCVISFTVETDGCIPTGETLAEAIESVDSLSDAGPLYYMINCAHPTHFDSVLKSGAPWVHRIGGVRANASRCSHAELDESETLDEGDPVEFGVLNAELYSLLPSLRVLGGCCGTDHRHVEQIVRAL